MNDVSLEPRQSDAERTLRGRSAADLAVAVAVVICGGVLFVSLDVVERLWPAAVRWEAAQLDDLFLTLCLAVAAAGWFSYRRWRESVTQLAALRRSSEERVLYMRKLEELSSQLLHAEETERNRVADVLHDEIGQTLYACQLKLGLLAQAVQDREARELLGEASELVSSTMTCARDLSVQLSPPGLQDLGLVDALLAAFPRLHARYAVHAQLMTGEAWHRVPARFHAPVFQSIQELVLNAAKHGGASTVTLSAEPEAGGGVRIVVADDGRGFDAERRAQGFGLFSIERRMACMNGALELTSAPGRGTVAALCLRA
jgi:signal transduction histidine kinase